MAKEWDKANMKTLAANMKRETAEAFQQYAKSQDTTVGALLRGFAEATVEGKHTDAAPRAVQGVPHILSYKNTDLLMSEVAHHNPDNLTPDALLNQILDEYFRFVKRVRK